jgi:hypothetical protein
MIPGKIYSDSGKTLDFEIEKSYGTGRVTARDNITGEQFAGEYVGIRETTSATSSSIGISGNRVANGFGSASVSSNFGNATAFLTGDKGNSLNCQMTIQTGLSPHGIGDMFNFKPAFLTRRNALGTLPHWFHVPWMDGSNRGREAAYGQLRRTPT